MTTALLQHIRRLLPGFTIPEEQLEPFFVNTRTVAKDTRLLAEGQPCDSIYFVHQGCLYLHYTHNGQLEVVHFAPENWWLTDYKTFAQRQPAVYAITAMEDSLVTSLTRSQYEALLLQIPAMALYFNSIHERAYGAALFKQKTFATVPKADFYRQFSHNYPAIIRRIPGDLFAAYMCISPGELEAFKDEPAS